MTASHGRKLVALAFVLTTMSPPVWAQMPHGKSIPTPNEPASSPLYTGVAPGSEGSSRHEQWVQFEDQRMARNVVKPTLTVYLPAAGKATGAGVVVAPGGGFKFVSMDNEGYPVAQYLADHGIAAFLLKYRVDPTPEDNDAFEKETAAMMAKAMDPNSKMPTPITPANAAMDGATALKLVRTRAAEWGVDPSRIGMLGFSAGAMLSLTMALSEKPGDRPAFVGLIYGPMNRVAVPPDAPPAFIAIAADDPLFARGNFDLVNAWRDAKRPVEFHLYQTGSHGFGTRLHEGTYAMWEAQFVDWMKWNGWLGKSGGDNVEPVGH